MYAVIFEFRVKPGQLDAYLGWTERLRERLGKVDGFLSIERFQSLSGEGRYVSISFWRDRAAVTAWRADPLHANAQAEGKAHVFAEFRLRTAKVVHEITLSEAGERAERDEAAL
ncbi:MAG TPA: antibiotic biosynthesis monooxygenase [Alphaproteobacteria bacterium]